MCLLYTYFLFLLIGHNFTNPFPYSTFACHWVTDLRAVLWAWRSDHVLHHFVFLVIVLFLLVLYDLLFMFLPFMRFSSKFSSLLCYVRKFWHLFDAIVQLTSCLDTIWSQFGNFFLLWEKCSFLFQLLFFWGVVGGGGGNEWSPVLSILGVFPNSIMKLICFAEMGSGIIEEKARFSCRIFVLLWLLIAPEKRVLKRAIFYWMRAIGRNLRILLCIVRTEEKVSNICLPFGEYNEQ